MNAITRFVSQVGFKVKEKSPELLMITGAVGFLAAGYKLWKARPKYEIIMEAYHESMDEIDATLDKAEEMGEPERYSEEDARADRWHIKLHTGVELVKLFTPVAFLSLSSLLSFGGATSIYKIRYFGMSRAYSNATARINFLEKGIVAAYGKDALDKLNGKIEKKEIVQNEDGSTEEVTVEDKAEEAGILANECLFDSISRNFEKDPELNMNFLRGMEQTMTNILLSRTSRDHPGFIFLNEVKAALDLRQTQEGQLIGWMNYYNPEDNIKNGCDGFVSFGIDDISRDEKNRSFRLGYEPAVWLKFNTDPTPIIGRCGMAVK